MRLTRFHTTTEGGSVFVDLDIDLPHARHDPQGHLIRSSNRYASPSVQFVELPEGLDQDWHCAPRRQIVIVLSGTLEVTTSDGTARRFGPGQGFLADDMGGKGHLTRAVDGAVQVLFAPMPPDVDLAEWAATG
jgi:quercetin dioxygenase-like cupin family protein